MAAEVYQVHVYANGRGFVVVPVILMPDNKLLEITPVERVSFTLGRATIVELSRVLRAARATGSSEAAMTSAPWDGDNGRWWAHNLAFVKLSWRNEGVIFAPQAQTPEGEWQATEVQELAQDISDDELSRMLVQYLGVQLHA